MNNKSALIEFTVVVAPAGMGAVKALTCDGRVEMFHLLRWATHGALIPGFALLDGSTLYASKDFPKSAYKMAAMATVSVTRCQPNWLLTRQEEKARATRSSLDKVTSLW